MRGLHEFLAEAELGEYYCPLLTRLKVTTVEHLRYVRPEDLADIGMTKPEMRRLKKFYKRECPHGTIQRLKKALLKGGGDGSSKTVSTSSLAPHKGPQPASSSTNAPYLRPQGRQLISLDSIQLGRTLGEGEFGIVQQGVWRTEQGEMLQVAVKRLSRERMNTGTQNFLKEAAIMQEVDNEHIVRMFGVVLDTENNMMLVTELAPMRSLLECLRDPTLRVDLAVTRLCDYAIQVCDGMTYLERKRLVHRDLAARNILVFNKNQVKISDLGLSRLLGAGQNYYQSKFSVNLRLPIAWCAPECINFLKFTSASDVWSFAIMLWEFFTYGFQPWAGLSSLQILEAIDEPNFQRLEQPELCTPEIYKLMAECWAHDPEVRPRFSHVGPKLYQLRPVQVKALKDYPATLVDKGYLHYKAGDSIVVIDKRDSTFHMWRSFFPGLCPLTPMTRSSPGLVWKGVLANGRSGLFDPNNTAPFLESKASEPVTKATSIIRRDSSRKSGRKVRADMISLPQNDLRHMGHIGFDGAVFGDVSFIGDNYDKLPIRTSTGTGPGGGASLGGHTNESMYHNGHVGCSSSHTSSLNGSSGPQQTWTSQESLNSQSKLQVEHEGRYSPNYLDIDDDDDSVFSDFKIPELANSFDLGPSFMDEVLKALDEKEKQGGAGMPVTPTGNHHHHHFFDSSLRMSSARPDPPLPAPREIRTSLSSTAPAPPPQSRVEHPKEKKQAKVKPMSAAEEKMVDNAIARARELTSHLIGSTCSPPVSPSQDTKSSFFDEETGIISRLKNSIKLSSSPKNGRKRTFSEELEQKGDLNTVTPEAQQAYNMLVVKGSFKQKSLPDFQRHAVVQDGGKKDAQDSRRTRSQSSSKSSQEFESSDWLEPNVARDSRSHSSSTRNSASVTPRPVQVMLPSQPPAKSVFVSPSKPSSSPAPVLSPQPGKADSPVGSELPTPRACPGAQRVESTARYMVPTSLDIMANREQYVEIGTSVAGSKDCSQPKFMIELVQTDDLDLILDDVFEKASTSLQHSTAHSGQTLSGNHSETTAYSSAESNSKYPSSYGCSSQDTDTNALVIPHKDVPNKKEASLFEDDLVAPSPQEIMSRLRERRLNRLLQHQRTVTAESETSASRPRPSAREPLGIPSRGTCMAADEDGVAGGSEEVDTNPLRLLRGGAVPVRMTGRGSGGMSHLGSRGTKALRVPQLNFSKHLSSSAVDQQQGRDSSGHQSAALVRDTDAVPESSSSSVLSSDPSPADVISAQSSWINAFSSQPASASAVSSQDAPVHSVCSQPTSASSVSYQSVSLGAVSSQPASARSLSSEPALASSVSSQSTSAIAVSSTVKDDCAVAVLEKLPGKTQEIPPALNYTELTGLTVSGAHIEKHQKVDFSGNHPVNLTLSPTISVGRPPFHDSEETPPLKKAGAVASDRVPQTSNVENLAPPRLPPRRSQSLNENSEKAAAYSSMLSGSLRRRSSTEESNDTEAPALPPRQPHGVRTPLNARPRERKFPLQIQLSSQEKNSSTQQQASPKCTSGLPLRPKQISQLKSPTRTVPSSSSSPTSAHSPQQFTAVGSSSRHQSDAHAHWQQSSNMSSPTSSTRHPPSRHSSLHNSPRSLLFETPDPVSHSPHHHHHHHHHHHRHHHSSSIELPPPYDLSLQQSISLADVADSEPTHMLLDPHTPPLPIPLSVSLPPACDLSAADEPTHVSLSSLSSSSDNKHSWSATFTSPSPLSPSFHHKHPQPPVRSSHNSTNSAMTRSLDRSFSSEATVPSIYPDFTDNQSPPADLPPAPPTPSYREKLGLENHRPKVVRSISHNSNTFKSGPHFLTVDSSSSFFSSSFRGKSASTNSPSSRSHHTDLSNTSPSHTSSHHLPHYSHETHDDDDDAFFAEAPSYPHPYSQSPFHPLVPASPRDTTQTSTIYSSVSFSQSPADITPYQVSSAISHTGESAKGVSVFEPAPPLPALRRGIENPCVDPHAHAPPTHDSTARHLLPRTCTSPTHTYNSVSLSCSQTSGLPAGQKPTPSNLTLKPASVPARQPDTQTLSTAHHHHHHHHHSVSQPSTTSQIFKFPSIVRTEDSSLSPPPLPPSSSSSIAAAAQSNHGSTNNPDLSPSVEYPSSSEVSPLMFASYSATSSVSYEDLRQFALDRQKNCEEIEKLLEIFPDQVTVDECMTALEGTHWDVNKAAKYLQLKKLLTLGMADVHRCKEALSACGWDLQAAAEALLESTRTPASAVVAAAAATSPPPPPSSSSSSSLSSSSRGSPARTTGVMSSHHRPTSPEVLDV